MKTRSAWALSAALTLLCIAPQTVAGQTTGKLMQFTAHSKEHLMGRSIDAPTVNRKICMSAGKIDPRQFMAKKHGNDCKIGDYHDKNDTVTYQVTCTRPQKVESTGTFHRQDDGGFQGKMHTTLATHGMQVAVDTEYTGKPVGTCDYKPPKSAAAKP